jgi:hypothetical protein
VINATATGKPAKARNSVSIVAHFIGGLTDVCCSDHIEMLADFGGKILNPFQMVMSIDATVELLERFGDFL